MKKKSQLNEVRQLQKIAGILKEDTFDSTPSIKVGDEVRYHLEGERSEFGIVLDIAKNWDEVLQKGGKNIDAWESLFTDEEYANEMGYDSLKDWEAEFVNKCKNNYWFEVETGEDYFPTATNPEGWYPAEYVTPYRKRG